LGFALSKIGPKAKPFLGGLKSIEDALFAVIKIIMRVAPLGALGAMSFTIGKYGLSSLVPLGKLMGSFYLTCILFIVIILGGIIKYTGFNIFRLLNYIKEELLIVLGTSSSESALPSLMDKLRKAGCSEPVVGLVVPTGYSFNLDGTSIYLTMAVVFLAQATNTPLELGQQLSLLLILMLASKGAAGVSGSGFITLALTNIIGNSIATIVIAKSENEIDMVKAKELIG
jgi:aerobic C4-dicarboxylate transport protein